MKSRRYGALPAVRRQEALRETRQKAPPEASAFSAPGEDERAGTPVVRAARALRDLGYDQRTITALFLQGAALFGVELGPEEFERLARRCWIVTERQLAEIRAEGQVLS